MPKPRRPSNTALTQFQPAKTPIINICQISANALYFNMKRPGAEFFQISIYELDWLINESYEEDIEIELLLDRLLPAKYWKFHNTFSKVKSDQLPPHYSYNYKIQLKEPLLNHFLPLYRQLMAEL